MLGLGQWNCCSRRPHCSCCAVALPGGSQLQFQLTCEHFSKTFSVTAKILCEQVQYCYLWHILQPAKNVPQNLSQYIICLPGSNLLCSSEFVCLHEAGQVINTDNSGPGGHRMGLYSVLRFIQVRNNACQLLSCPCLFVALHQIPN